ncbi:MAG: type III-B CRISPR module RAMP protein Cmr4 [Fimbriimonadales bacterium]|nr:MAG: type III-B CRISPR module RAMP protein Cmr4 [Fimbriimonadales bacterium]
MSKTKLIFLHALTPLHVGTGQAVANVDLPIAREKSTGFPIVPASAFKGVLRDEYLTTNNQGKLIEPDWVQQAFGTQDAAGEWMFTDLRILCLPVRSFYGVFAYVTCPLILKQLQRNAQVMGVPGLDHLDIEVDISKVAVPLESKLQHQHQDKDKDKDKDKVYLEDIDLDCALKDRAQEIGQTLAQILFDTADQAMFLQRFAIVSNETFQFFSETGTEIVARVRLEDYTKTVASGGLWYEECAPTESIFYGFVAQTKTGASHDPLKSNMMLQIGGDATIGRGLCRVVIHS